MDAVLAIDIGASALKAGLVTPEGRLAWVASEPAVVTLAADGAAEMPVERWWDAFLAALARLPRDHPPIAAIAICGMTRTQVLVDGHGVALHPALTWRDTRAGDVASEIASALDEPVDATHPAARLAWAARKMPDVAVRATAALDPKDWLAARLTGVLAGDAIALARLACLSRARDTALVALHRLVPPLLEPGTIIGRVRPGAALHKLDGLPVVMASHDTWAAVAGLGALVPGGAYAIGGTSDVCGVIADRPVHAEGLIAIPWGRGIHQLGGPSQTGGDGMAWLGQLLGVARPDAAWLESLLAGERRAPAVLMLPFPSGERTPHWDAGLRAQILGLGRHHGPTDLAWALVEGQALAQAEVVRRAEAALGAPVAVVRLGGGQGASERIVQLKADALGRPVETMAETEAGLLGAAMAAFMGLGRFADLGAAQRAMARVGARHAPDPARHAAYVALLDIHRAALAATRGVTTALGGAAIPGGGTRIVI